jgi:hemoglobin
MHEIVRIRIVALGIGFALLAACAGRDTGIPALYDELGGEPGVAAIVDAFILEIAQDELVRPHFRTIDIAGFRGRLEEFLCVVADGECKYSGRSMPEAHATLGIERAAFNSIVEDLIAAMDSNGISYATQNALLARLAVMEADIVTVR